jgi:hypothetical protein
VHQVVDVGPVGGGGAASEDAALVAQLDGAAQVRGHDPPAAPDAQRQPVVIEQHGGDGGVAGHRPRPGRRQRAAEAGGGRARAGGGIVQVAGADGDHHGGSDGAQHRQVACGQRVVGQLHEGVGQLLGAAAPVPGRAGGRQQRLQSG